MTKIGSTNPRPAGFDSAIASSAVAAFLLDGARHITAANASAATLTGYSSNALLGLSLRAIFAAHDDWAEAEANVAAGAEHRALASMESTIRRHDGTLIDVSFVLMPQFDDAGRMTGAVAFAAPCDAPVEAPGGGNENAMIRFARGAAHDFKNLLAIITGNVQLAASETRLKPRAAFLADAERACAMAARLANQMIAFARNRLIEPVSLSLDSVFEQQAAMLRAAAGPSVKLTFDVAPDTATVHTDRSGLESALLNLVVNARDAMPKGGAITVSAENAKTPPASGVAQNLVAIRVRDTGTGMTERVRQRAFDPFFSTKPLSHGTGLGLATVLGFARQSGGHAEIESTIGEGTTVTIFLPVEPSR